MPFGEVNYPSLGLTQLKSVIEEEFEGVFEVKIIYLNHDFAAQMGLEQYQKIVSGPTMQTADLMQERYYANAGDWLFRQLAFPELPDNADAYFSRFFSKNQSYSAYLRSLRDKLYDILIGFFEMYRFQDADIIGFTSMFQQQLPVIAMSRIIKNLSPHVITFAGGSNFAYPAAEIFARYVQCIDYIFSGPGLISVPKFLRCIVSNQPEKIKAIQGIYPAGELHKKEIAEHLCSGEERDINQVVYLDYSDFLDSAAKHFPEGQLKPELFFETSRGCWWGEKMKCTFCDYNGKSMKFRSMDSDKAQSYLESLIKYLPYVVRLRAVDGILPKNYIGELFPKINQNKNMHMFYEVKVGHSREEIKLIAQAGIDYIQAGIESLHTPSLKKMKKGTTVFENIRFLKDCDLFGIRVLWNLLTGIPDEDQEVYLFYKKNLQLFYHLPAPTGLWAISYDRDCDYVVNSQKYNLKLHPDIHQLQYLYPFTTEELERIAYFYLNEENSKIFSLQRMKKIYQINDLIQKWKECRDNQKFPAALYIEKGNEIYIVDTRYNIPRKLQINNQDYLLLTDLDQPQNIDSLLQRYPDIESEFLKQKVLSFIENGFVFQEGTQMISLVLPEKPARLRASSIDLESVVPAFSTK